MKEIQNKHYLKTASNYFKKFDIDLDDFENEGFYGILFKNKKGQIVKFTTDPEEFNCANRIKNNNFNNIVNILDTEQLKDGLYAITQEKVATEKAFSICNRMNKKIKHSGISIEDIIIKDIVCDRFRFNEEEKKLITDLKKAVFEMKKETNYNLLDIHEENIGMRGDSFLLFDQKDINISYEDSLETARLTNKVDNEKLNKISNKNKKSKLRM